MVLAGIVNYFRAVDNGFDLRDEPGVRDGGRNVDRHLVERSSA